MLYLLFIDKMLSVTKVLLLFQITAKLNNNLMFYMRILKKEVVIKGLSFF